MSNFDKVFTNETFINSITEYEHIITKYLNDPTAVSNETLVEVLQLLDEFDLLDNFDYNKFKPKKDIGQLKNLVGRFIGIYQTLNEGFENDNYGDNVIPFSNYDMDNLVDNNGTYSTSEPNNNDPVEKAIYDNQQQNENDRINNQLNWDWNNLYNDIPGNPNEDTKETKTRIPKGKYDRMVNDLLDYSREDTKPRGEHYQALKNKTYTPTEIKGLLNSLNKQRTKIETQFRNKAIKKSEQFIKDWQKNNKTKTGKVRKSIPQEVLWEAKFIKDLEYAQRLSNHQYINVMDSLNDMLKYS